MSACRPSFGLLTAMLLAAVALMLTTASSEAVRLAQSSASISLNPGQGPPGTSVTVTGSSWPAKALGRIHWDGAEGTVLGSFSVNPNGGFTVGVTVPGNAPPGGHSIWACTDPISPIFPQICASRSFKVTGSAPTQPPPPTAPPPTQPPPPTAPPTLGQPTAPVVGTAPPSECDPHGVAGERVLTFEELPTGRAVQNQSIRGATFLSDSDLVIVEPTVEAHSGRRALQGPLQFEFGSARLDLEIRFDFLQDFVGVVVGVDQETLNPVTATLQVFDAAGSSLGTDSHSLGIGPRDIDVCLAVSAPGIYRATISYGGEGAPELIDDLVFRGPATPVPVPDDDTPPVVRIDTPAEGARITESVFDVQGTVTEDRGLMAQVEVRINGGDPQMVPAPGSVPNFAYRLAGVPSTQLTIGVENLIEVEATDLAGNKGYAVAHIRYVPQPEIDIIAEAVEVTQVIQCLDNPSCPDNSVDLYMSNPTLVRLYVRSEGGFVPRVHGRLCISHFNTGAFEAEECVSPPQAINVLPVERPTREHRGDLSRTLNFLIPSRWSALRNVPLRLEVTVNPDGVDAEELTLDNNRVYQDIIFRKGRDLNVVGLRVWADHTVIPRDQIMDGMVFISRYYPTSGIDFYLHNIDPVDADFNYRKPVGWGNLLIRLDWIRLWTTEGFSKPRYHAFLSPYVDWDEIDGMAWMPIDGRIYARSSASIHLSRDGAGDTAAHELAHNHELYHSPGGCAGGEADANHDYPQYVDSEGVPYGRVSIGEWGIDLYSAPMRLLSPSDTYDLMSYCGPRWMSLYTYAKLARNINEEGRENRDGYGVARVVPPETEALAGSGVISPDGVVFDPPAFFHLPLQSDDPLTPADGPYQVRLMDAAGGILYEQAFRPEPTGESGDELEGAFFLVLPWQDGVARVEIAFDGRPIGVLEPGGAPPLVRLIEPNGGEVWKATGSETIRWEASDPDGDPLRAVVRLSPDGNGTWVPLMTDADQQRWTGEVGALPGGEAARVEVCVSDGLHTACDQSDAAFTIPEHGPEVFITSPENGQSFSSGEQVILEGIALDSEEGSVEDGPAYAWASDLDGELGMGRGVWGIPLSVGRHEITLTVADSSGAVGFDTVTITVGTPPEGTGAAPGTGTGSPLGRLGVIVGGIGIGLAAVIGVGLLLWALFNPRRRSRK